MRNKIIFGLVIILLLVGGFYIRRNAVKNTKSTLVKTVAIGKGTVKSYLSTTGIIKSKNSRDYISQQLKVSKVNVKIGDNIKKGDLLVSFDLSDLNTGVKQSELQYNNAVLSKQMLVNSNNEINNKIADIDKQITDINEEINRLQNSKNPADSAKLQGLQAQSTQLKQAKENIKPISNEQLKQADNQINIAKLALESARGKIAGKDSIIAEFDGVVTAVNVIEGGIGNPALPAVTVQDISNLKAIVSVGKYDAAKVKLDQSAEVRNNGNTYNGKIAFINPVAKKSMGVTGSETTLDIEIDILDKVEGLKVDFDADVNILLGEKTNVINVPAEAIRSDKNGNTFVFVLEGDKAIERGVKLGLQSDINAEILEGLNEGEKIILNPVASIKSGTAVKEDTGGK